GAGASTVVSVGSVVVVSSVTPAGASGASVVVVVTSVVVGGGGGATVVVVSGFGSGGTCAPATDAQPSAADTTSAATRTRLTSPPCPGTPRATVPASCAPPCLRPRR